MLINKSPRQRLEEKFKISNSGCWEWIAAKDEKGYGRFYFNGKNMRAHRVSYIIYCGKIKKGFTIDHLCRNHGCIKPSHLEMVTNKENGLRGIGACAQNNRKTHCKNGHPFTKENTRHIKNGGRRCLPCKRIYEIKHRR